MWAVAISKGPLLLKSQVAEGTWDVQQQHLPPLSLEFLSQQLPSPGIVDTALLIGLLSIPFPSPQTHTTNTHIQLNENRELTGWFSATTPTPIKY